MSFAEILDAVDILPLDEQIEISRLLHLRLIDQKREILAQEILMADAELAKGSLKIQSVDSILNDILNEV
ncbi:MAG: hypothetical protein RO257_18290 [Candidatus Kapabacteria bacterium]|nr:hypothetical protein [Candidatus Kapabacteria bacterium]